MLRKGERCILVLMILWTGSLKEAVVSSADSIDRTSKKSLQNHVFTLGLYHETLTGR